MSVLIHKKRKKTLKNCGTLPAWPSQPGQLARTFGATTGASLRHSKLKSKKIASIGLFMLALALLVSKTQFKASEAFLTALTVGSFAAAIDIDWTSACDSNCEEAYCPWENQIRNEESQLYESCEENMCDKCYVCLTTGTTSECSVYLNDLGGEDSCLDFNFDVMDPACPINYLWRDGYGLSMNGSPTEIVEYYAGNNAYISEYDGSITIGCDNMTNYPDMFSYVYSCIYNAKFWTYGEAEGNNSSGNPNDNEFVDYNPTTPLYDCWTDGQSYDEESGMYLQSSLTQQSCYTPILDQIWNSADNADCIGLQDQCYRDTTTSPYSGFIDRMNPCRLFYDQYRICARCKFGAVRILDNLGIACGFQNGYSEQYYDDSIMIGDPIVYTKPYCEVDYFYNEMIGYDNSQGVMYFMTNRFYNSTTGLAEQLCVTEVLEYDEIFFRDNCTDLGNQYWFDNSDWEQLSADEQSRAEITVGCYQCDPDSNTLPAVKSLPEFGMFAQYCKYIGDQVGEENDLCDIGSILQWVGVIETERVLECKPCNELIPNCLSCSSSKQCDICKKGSRLASIIDSHGIENQVCITDFCGFYGEGSGCAGVVGLEGCARSTSKLSGTTWIETCIRCLPGYYIETMTSGTNSYDGCNPMKGKLTVEVFVHPFDSMLFSQDKQSFTFDLDTPFEEWKGFRLENPLYSLQNLFFLSQKNVSDFAKFSEVSISAFLFKGVHHFVRCHDEDLIEFSDVGDYESFNSGENIDLLSLVCFQEAMNYAEKSCTGTACQPYQSTYPSHSLQQVQIDNLNVRILALDCEMKDSVFQRATPAEKKILEDNCVDVAAGERPQIRIPNVYNNFNITNSYSFENIEFTGEDLFAQAKLNDETMGFGGDQGILAFMPFTKCSIQEDPAKLTTIDEITVKKMEFLKVHTNWRTVVTDEPELDQYGHQVLDEFWEPVYKTYREADVADFDYECDNSFNRTAVEPPSAVDNRCYPPTYDESVFPNSTTVAGEPYHDDFFWYSETNSAFTKRHKVLFNLYAFDSMRTLNTKPPRLDIINCKFKFFVNSLDALIQVENNNLGFFGADPQFSGSETDERILTFYGEDRGAMITIQNSEFLSNSFPKGIINYNQFQSISYSDAPRLLNFTANFQGTKEVNYKDDANNFVRILDSTFHNNAFHTVIHALNLDSDVYSQNTQDDFVSDINFRKFQDQGMIMNMQGYTGAIQVANSTFTDNMAYIQQILMHESLATDSFYDFDDKEMIIQYSNAAQTYIQLKKCVDQVWTSRYFFQEVIDPNGEFDDALVVDNIENVSPFMIKGNRGAVIFSNNYFKGNIGTTGGVIHIEDPDFRYGDNPSIVLSNNQFFNNMAYWAGNVFHIQMQMRMIYDDINQSEFTNDAHQTCGSGILVERNYFYGNVGLKRHNGGVGVIRCQHHTETAEDQFTFLSGKLRQSYYNIDAGNGQKTLVGMDLPFIHKSELTDLFDPTITYGLLTYGTLIHNNTFSNNFAGKKGSTLLIELINEVQILDNKFMGNGPVQTYREIEFSPYYKNFLYNQRTLSYYLLNKDQLGDCVDESAWFNRCYRSGYQIDMPQLQGTIFMDHCHLLDTCWIVGNVPVREMDLTFVNKFYRPWQNTQISNNYFYDNSANIVMFESQTQDQASALYIRGGTNTIIDSNEFTGHRNWADALMKTFAYDVWRYFPKNYFRYSHASLIKIEYPYAVYAEFFSELTAEEDFIVILTDVSNNLITDNLNMQVVTHASVRYRASIIDFDCELPYATLQFHGNEVTRNQFIGWESTFFHLNAGIALVFDNEFSYNGLLTTRNVVKTVSSFERQYKNSLFPWEDYEFDEAQANGIFTFRYFTKEMPLYRSHIFERNTFKHIYCQLGCAYYVEGNMIQQFSYSQNNYSYMVASQGSAVFFGTLTLQQSNALTQVWVQVFKNEVFESIYGGSIQLESNNGPITFIENSKFINNFGETGAAISFNKGGGLYIKETEFSLVYQDDYLRSQLADERDSTKILELIMQVLPPLFRAIYDSYDSRLSQSQLLSEEMFKLISQLENNVGQIYFLNTWSTVQNAEHPVVGLGNQKIADLILNDHEIELSSNLSFYSSIKNTAFIYTAGYFASSIMIDSSSLQLLGTNDEPNFFNNVTPLGSTFVAKQNSEVIQKRMGYVGNKGEQGACILIDSFTNLIDYDSEYVMNIGNKGGVIFAINDSKFEFHNVRFSENYAQQSGSVLYAMYNSQQKALSFYNCDFKRNFAYQNLIQLMSSEAYVENSRFVDNKAEIVNHGITMITSNLDFVNSTVTNTEEFAQTLTSKALAKVDTGFFSLFLSSSITLRDNSVISNLKALNQAVLNAQSMSSVYVRNEVYFVDNLSTNSAGQTFSLQNTNEVQINDAYFQGNQQNNIQVEFGQLNVVNSEFTQGKRNHIKGFDSKVRLSKVNVHDSKDTPTGHGFICIRCLFVSVEDSTFENLESTAGQGGAISLQQLKNNTFEPISYIKNNLFKSNKATSGGALHLDATHLLQISGNIFKSNEAVQSDGGAIKYLCNPTQLTYECTVSLINNEFTKNKALRKGGALRYENANFTDEDMLAAEQAQALASQSGTHGEQELRSLQSIFSNIFSQVIVETVLRPLDKDGTSPGNDFGQNEAAYGNDVASFPKYIEYTVPENQVGAKIENEQKNIQIAAGQVFAIELTIRDREGRIYNDENQGIAKIIFKPGQELGSQALMLGSDAVAKNGKFTFNTFNVRIQPSTSALITFQFQKLEHYGTEIEFLDFDPIFTVTARPCVEGEQYTEDLSCKPCPPSQYLYERQIAPGVCKNCQPEAFCYGMNMTAPRPGYWRSFATGEEFTQCIRPESCLGGNETDPIGQCERGYQGILCADCAPGYSRSGQTCSECPEVVLNIIIFVSMLFAVVFLIAFMVRSTLGGVETKKPLYQVFLKIFLNHFQILAAVSQIDFKWPTLIQSVLASQQGIADGPSQVLSVDCIIMDMFPKTSSSFRLNYVRLILFTLMPFIIFGVSQLFWAVYGRCKRILPQERSDKGTATAIIVLFLFYPTIVTIISKSVNCISIEGQTRLFDDLEEICYKGTHLIMLLTVSLPGLFAWVIGIPVYALYKLSSNVEALRQIQEFSAGKQHEDLLRRFRVRLGFLTAGYSDQYYYWEIYLLARKSLLVMSIVFLSSVSSGVQSLSSILFLMAFFLVQWRYQPYYDEQLNQMETLSLGVIILTIYAGLYYQAGEGDPFMESQPVTWVIFFAVLAPSVSFAVNFARKMWVEILKVIANKSAKLFRYATCGMKDLTEFRMQYMEEDTEEGDEDHELKEPAPKEENLNALNKNLDNQVTDKLRQSMSKARIRSQNERYDSFEDLSANEEQKSQNSIKALEEGPKKKEHKDEYSYSSFESESLSSSDQQSDSKDKKDDTGERLQGRGTGARGSVSDEPFMTDISAINGKLPEQSKLANEKTSKNTQQAGQTQKQNFEYKDEVYFRGEKVKSGGDRRKVYEIDDDELVESDSANESAMNNNSKQKILKKPLENSLNIDFEPKKGPTNLLANVLLQIKAIKAREQEKESEDADPFANSRNNQQALKSGVNKPAGVSMQSQSKGADVEQKTQEQKARMHLLKQQSSMGGLLQQQVESDGVEDGLDSNSSDFDDLAQDKGQAKGKESTGSAKKTEKAAASRSSPADSSKQDVNIFKKQVKMPAAGKAPGGKVAAASLQKRKKDDEREGPSPGLKKHHGRHLSQNQIISRRKSSFDSDSELGDGLLHSSVEDPRKEKSKQDARSGRQDHGRGQKSYKKERSQERRKDDSRRDMLDRVQDPSNRGGKPVKSSSRSRKRSEGRSPARDGDLGGHDAKAGDDESVAAVSEWKSSRTNKQGKSNRQSQRRQADVESDFLSDEQEGQLGKSIRGNTERNVERKQGGKDQEARGVQAKEPDEEKKRAVASPPPRAKDMFYRNQIDLDDGIGKPVDKRADQQAQPGDQQEDAEAQEVNAGLQKRKRKRNKKKSGKGNNNNNNNSNKKELNIFKNGQDVPGNNTKKNTINEQLMELQKKQDRKDQGLSSSDDSLDFV